MLSVPSTGLWVVKLFGALANRADGQAFSTLYGPMGGETAAAVVYNVTV